MTSTVQVSVRPASLADVDALTDVELHTALTAYADIFPPSAPTPTRAEFANRWRSRLARVPTGVGIFVAVVDDTVVGLVMADPDPTVDPDPHHHGHLRALYIHPTYWGQGLGRRLHDTAREYLHIARPHLHTLTLWVMEKNTRARTRYESWGWHPTGLRQTIHPTIDELHYEITQPPPDTPLPRTGGPGPR